MIKKIFLIIVALSLFCQPVQALVSERPQALKEAYIKYEQTGWQTYHFFALTNFPKTEAEKLDYEWSIDSKKTVKADEMRHFFEKGDHVVSLKVEDEYGNIKYDKVRLNVNFWSLKNNWFWWLVYTIVILIVIYYWVIKIVYLLNKRKMSKRVRYFLDLLDEHGWVEKMVKEHVKKNDLKNENKYG